MESIALLHIIVSAIVLILLLWGCNQLSRKLRPQRTYQAKFTTYESGAAPIGHARTALKSPIYVLGLIFLLFELETILLFPWALVYTQSPPPRSVMVFTYGYCWYYLYTRTRDRMGICDA